MRPESESPQPSGGKDILGAALGLGAYTLLTAGLVLITWIITRAPIKEAQAAAEAATLAQVLPNTSTWDEFVIERLDAETHKALDLPMDRPAYRAYRAGEAPVLILPWQTREGYNGLITGIAGLASSGQITGVRVLFHRETPGLGDRIERQKSDWIVQFEGHQPDAPPLERWRLRTDGGVFDSLSGATITARATVAGLRELMLAIDDREKHFQNRFRTPPATDPESSL